MRNINLNGIMGNGAGNGPGTGKVPAIINPKDLRRMEEREAERVAVLNGLGDRHRMIVGNGVACELVWPGGAPSNPSSGIVYLIVVVKSVDGRVSYEGVEVKPGQDIDAIFYMYSYFCVTMQEEMEEKKTGSSARFMFTDRDSN